MEEELNKFENELTQIEKEFSEYFDRTNIFEILNIVDKELKHSDFIAYIFNPNRNHGLGIKPLKGLCEMIRENTNSNFKIENYNDAKVLREDHHMDILIISDTEKKLICIENKIGTVNFEGQLEKYDNKLEEYYKDYAKLKLYLTPDNSLPIGYKGSSIWYPIGYNNILEVLDNKEIVDIDSIKSESVRCLIKDYIDNLRRNIMTDEELKEKCNKIYLEHKRMFDLVNEYRDNEVSNITNAVREYLNDKKKTNQIFYKENVNANTTIWFITPTLNKYLPSVDVNNINMNNIRQNKCMAYFNIYVDKKNYVYVGLFFNYDAINENGKIKTIDEMNDRINEFLDIYNQKKITRKQLNYQIASFPIEDMETNEVIENLDRALDNFLEK